jgi:Protein of unknown function (DUF3180)
MRPVRTTRIALLVVLLVLGGALGWTGVAVLQATGTNVGRVSWSAAGGLTFFAALLLAGAWYMYDRVHRRRRIVDGLTAVRLLALAKASALVGALVAGVYVGFALQFAPDYAASSDARDKVIRGAVTALAAVVVVVGAMLLERACKVPRGPDDNETPGRASGAGDARGHSR